MACSIPGLKSFSFLHFVYSKVYRLFHSCQKCEDLWNRIIGDNENYTRNSYANSAINKTKSWIVYHVCGRLFRIFVVALHLKLNEDFKNDFYLKISQLRTICSLKTLRSLPVSVTMMNEWLYVLKPTKIHLFSRPVSEQ